MSNCGTKLTLPEKVWAEYELTAAQRPDLSPAQLETLRDSWIKFWMESDPEDLNEHKELFRRLWEQEQMQQV